MERLRTKLVIQLDDALDDDEPINSLVGLLSVKDTILDIQREYAKQLTGPQLEQMYALWDWDFLYDETVRRRVIG